MISAGCIKGSAGESVGTAVDMVLERRMTATEAPRANFAQVIVGQVAGDGKKKTAEVADVRQCCAVVPDPDKGFLGKVLGQLG